jgi:cobalt-zinc-cadmium efflux system outer membrane protein
VSSSGGRRSGRCVAVVALGLVLAAAPAIGQSAGAPTGRPPLTLADAVALARARHPAIAAASARRRVVLGRARQEGALPNPVLEWRRENLGSPLQRDAFVTVTQPLDLTGRRLALRAEAGDHDRRATADSLTVAREVEAAAARAYWRAALARALLALATEQREDADRLAACEAERAREGAVAEVAAMRARVEAERARLAEALARAESARAAAELARATGVPPDSLAAPPALEPAPPATPPAPALDVAVARARAGRSELAAHRAAADAAGHRLSAERCGALGDVVAVAGTKQTAGFATRVVGLAVPLPLLDRNAAGAAAAAGALALTRAELRAAEMTVESEVASAVDGYAALVAARPAGGDSLAARASEVARIADAAYAAGGGSLLELLDARRARAEALTAALRWVADLRLAAVELRRAVGASPLEPAGVP